MSLILNIETATDMCSVSLAQDGQTLTVREDNANRSHSSVITLLIKNMLAETGYSLKDMDAVAVGKGPGSYTGLRIGVSTAKGLCLSLDIPLISVSTLRSMAIGMQETLGNGSFLKALAGHKSLPVPELKDIVLYPMIDARRMEAYYAAYDMDNNCIQQPVARIVEKNILKVLHKRNVFIIFGISISKCQFVFSDMGNVLTVNGFYPSAAFMSELSYIKYAKGEYEDLAYFEPFYLKEFFTLDKRKN